MSEPLVRWLRRLYYAFNRWRFGEGYGCGRCHHPVGVHFRDGMCLYGHCPCKAYSIERVSE